MPLKIHIGLAMGELCHIIVGLPNIQNDSIETENTSSILQQSSKINGRLEYCISGPVVQKAGELLGFAKSGEVAFSKNCWILILKKLKLKDKGNILFRTKFTRLT